MRVQLGALAPYLRGEWQLAEEATLGELTIRILAERFVDRAARGRDRRRLGRRPPDGARPTATSWRSSGSPPGTPTQDATEFFDAWRAILADRHPGAPRAPRRTSSTSAGADPYDLERRGTKVLVDRGSARPRSRRARRAHLAAQHVRAERAVGADRRGAGPLKRGARSRRTALARRANGGGRWRAGFAAAAVSPRSHARYGRDPARDREHDRFRHVVAVERAEARDQRGSRARGAS